MVEPCPKILATIRCELSRQCWVSDRIGHLYQEKGNRVEAEKAYRRAYSVNAGQFGYCLGISLMDLERHAAALPLLLAAAEQYQPDAMSWHNVAICYERTGKTEDGNIEKAEVAYKKAIEIDPNYATAWFDLGGYYWNQGDHLNAYSTWEKAIQKFPKHPDCERVKKLLANPFQTK
jgi:tetratricopeptide (TPR) repeat protein